MVTEETLVGMLLDVAGGEVADERDVQLARYAARWAAGHGWKLHLHNSFFFEIETLSFWILAARSSQTLEIRVRLGDGRGWQTHARHRVAHVGHGLAILVDEGLLPACFSPIGRQALEDFDALDRGASPLWRHAATAGPQELAEYGAHYPWEMRIRSAVMGSAADQARAFPRGQLAAMTS